MHLRTFSSVLLIEMLDVQSKELKCRKELLLNHSVIRDTRQQNTTYRQDKFGYINLHQFLILSKTFSYWDKQQSADSSIIQFHLSLKFTEDQY